MFVTILANLESVEQKVQSVVQSVGLLSIKLQVQSQITFQVFIGKYKLFSLKTNTNLLKKFKSYFCASSFVVQLETKYGHL